MTNPNCVNICLGNELLTEIDKYAKRAGLSRADAMKYIIQFLEDIKHQHITTQPSYWGSGYSAGSNIPVERCIHCGCKLFLLLHQKYVNGQILKPLCQSCFNSLNSSPPQGYNVSQHGIEHCVSCTKKLDGHELMTKWVNGKPISPLCRACFNTGPLPDNAFTGRSGKNDPPWMKKKGH